MDLMIGNCISLHAFWVQPTIIWDALCRICCRGHLNRQTLWKYAGWCRKWRLCARQRCKTSNLSHFCYPNWSIWPSNALYFSIFLWQIAHNRHFLHQPVENRFVWTFPLFKKIIDWCGETTIAQCMMFPSAESMLNARCIYQELS